MKTLIFGNDSIEFGYCVATWAPVMRHAAQRFERVVAVCKEQNRYLYEDFATDFEYFEQKGKPDMWYVNRKPDILPKVPKYIRRKYPDATYYAPSRKKCLEWPRKYFQYGNYEPATGYEVVIHARAETKYGQHVRNWPKENYQMMLEQIGNPRACSIGTKAYHVPGTEDLRNLPLKQLCDVISSSGVVVGTSSGPLHLSHLCRTAIIVLSGKKKEKAIKATNRERYTRLWRAFDSPVVVLDHSWQPCISEVAREVKKFV
jgi:hypothetical protein